MPIVSASCASNEMGSDEYDVAFAQGASSWTLALDRAGKIIMLNFRPK